MITSRQNAQVKWVRSLATRRPPDLCLAEGVRLLEEVTRPTGETHAARDLRAAGASHPEGRVQIELLVHSPRLERSPRGQALLEQVRRQGVRELAVSDEVMESLGDAQTSQGVLAVVRVPPVSEETFFDGCGVWVWADGLQDPGNWGTLARSALAFGARGLVSSGRGVDPFSAKAVRASMGALLRLPVLRIADPAAELRRRRERWRGAAGPRVVAAVIRGGTPLAEVDFSRPTVLLVGSEAEGLSDELVDLADARLTIPMPGGSESLNAAVAASIILYQAAQSGSRT